MEVYVGIHTDLLENLEEELLEDIEAPYLTSIYSSDTQSSYQDVLGHHSSGIPDATNVNITDAVKEEKVEEVCENVIFRNEKTFSSTVYKEGFSSKKANECEFNRNVSRLKSLEFIDWEHKHGNHRLNSPVSMRFGSSLSFSLPDLTTSKTVFSQCRHGVKSSTYVRFVKNPYLIRAKMFISLPNLNIGNDRVKVLHKPKELFREISPKGSYIHERLFCDSVFTDMNENYFENDLTKRLIKRLHSQQHIIQEKDVIISELLKSYDKLLIKYAEAENKIDKMRFEYVPSSSTESTPDNSKTTATHLPFWTKSVVNNNTLEGVGANCNACFEYPPDVIVEGSESNTPEIVPRSPSLDNYFNERTCVSLYPYASEEKYNESNLDFNGKSNGLTFQKGLSAYDEELHKEGGIAGKFLKEHPEKDVSYLCEGDTNFHCSITDNKMNLDEYDAESFDKSKVDFSVEQKCFDSNKSISVSEDEFSFGSQENNLCLLPNHGGIFKNGFYFSNNKIPMYAKTKRELISYPEVYQTSSFFDNQHKSGFCESLPIINDLKIQENYLDSSCQRSIIDLANERGNSKVKRKKNVPLESVDFVLKKFEHKSTSGTTAVNSDIKPENGRCHIEEKCLTKQSVGVLNNNFQEAKCIKSACREYNAFQSPVVIEKTGLSFKMSDSGMEKIINPVMNKVPLEIKNGFEEINEKILTHNERLQTFKKQEKLFLDELDSENSSSLDSIKLEVCECWDGSTSPMKIRHQIRTHYNCEPLSSLNYPRISPLLLELSSSGDAPLPVLSSVSMDNSISKDCEAIKSLEDLTTIDGETEERNHLQMNARFCSICEGTQVTKSSAKPCSDKVLSQNAKSSLECPKKLSQLINSLNKADYLVSKLKDKSEELKTYLSLQLESIS